MITLVTLAQAKAHLRVDHDEDDVDIQSKVDQASAIVIDYLKIATVPDRWTGATAFGSPMVGVPGEVQAATLLIIGELHNKREGGDTNVLSDAVCSLLWRHRTPAMA